MAKVVLPLLLELAKPSKVIKYGAMYGSTGGHWAKAKWDEPKDSNAARIIPFLAFTLLVHERESLEKIAFFIGVVLWV